MRFVAIICLISKQMMHFILSHGILSYSNFQAP